MSSSTLKEKYRKLVEALVQRTRDKSINWSYDLLTDVPAILVAGRIISIALGKNQNREPLVTINIMNGDGSQIEAFDDEYISAAKPTIAGFDSYYVLMELLHDMAVEAAKGVDNHLDAILSELDDDLPF